MYYKGHEDAVNVMRPITKGSWLIQRPDTAIDIINHAYKVAISGRPGPVFVQVPFDIQFAEIFGHAESPFTRISTHALAPTARQRARRPIARGRASR